jgi:hypothetical protein
MATVTDASRASLKEVAVAAITEAGDNTRTARRIAKVNIMTVSPKRSVASGRLDQNILTVTKTPKANGKMPGWLACADGINFNVDAKTSSIKLSASAARS